MHNNSREKLREIYQCEDNSQKTFIPAKPKADPNERNRFSEFVLIAAFPRIAMSSYPLMNFSKRTIYIL